MSDLNKRAKVTQVLAAQAAGTGTVNSTAVDMTHNDEVMFVVPGGTISATSVTTTRLQEGDAADGSDAVDIAGTTVTWTPTTDNDQTVVYSTYRRKKKYQRVQIQRATANAAFSAINAIQTQGRLSPETDGAGIKQRVTVVTT